MTRPNLTTREQLVAEFHHAMGQGENLPLTPEVLRLRLRLLEEEFDEVSADIAALCHTLDKGRRPKPAQVAALLKEMADLQYVLSGLAVTFGLPLQEAFERVHRSNLSKLDPATGRPIFREDGKVLKGADYRPADVSDLVSTIA
jgi:predicted HAD superfamily Cof-like phosphohydrolase